MAAADDRALARKKRNGRGSPGRRFEEEENWERALGARRAHVVEDDADVLDPGLTGEIEEDRHLVVEQLAVGGEEDDLRLAALERLAHAGGEVGLGDHLLVDEDPPVLV